MKAWRIAGVLVTALAAVARAQTTQPGVDVEAFLTPFVNSQTLVVAHADMEAVDTRAIEVFAGDLLDDLKVGAEERGPLKNVRETADGILAKFRQVGGRHVFALVSEPDIHPGMDPRAFLIPVEGGQAAGPMVELVQSLAGKDLEVKEIRTGVVFAGSKAALSRLEDLKAEARPELRLYTGAPVEAEIGLSDDLRKMGSELLPTLPAELGGGPTAALLKNLRNVTIVPGLPPSTGLSVSVHFTGRAGAADEAKRGADMLGEVIERLREKALGADNLQRMLTEAGFEDAAVQVQRLVNDLMTPSVRGGASGATEFVDMVFKVNERQIREMTRLLGPAMAQAREKARRTASISQVKQLLVGSMMYASDNGNALPATLDVLVEKGIVPKEMLKDFQGKPYVYRPPAVSLAQVKNASGTPMVWESFTAEGGAQKGGVIVGFVDGHVELMKDPKALEQLIKETDGKPSELP